MYLDICFNLEDDELDEFLEEVEEEINNNKNEIEDVVVVDGVIELNENNYKEIYFEVFDFDIDFETKKDEAIGLIKTEIEKYI